MRIPRFVLGKDRHCYPPRWSGRVPIVALVEAAAGDDDLRDSDGRPSRVHRRARSDASAF